MGYCENFSKNYTQQLIDGLQLTRLDIGNAYIVPVIGMGSSNRIIATTKKNLAYGYNSLNDDTFFNFEEERGLSTPGWTSSLVHKSVS